MTLIEEKKIIIHLPDTTTAEIIRDQSREKIIERIREGAGAAPTNRQMIAVRKLKSGDLIIYINSTMTKKEIKTTVD
jgi:hypothetical protein